MEQLQKWFEEAKVIKVFTFDDHEFVIRNGFKITHYIEGDLYTIQDIRLNDFYDEVTEQDLTILIEKGFIQGTDIIMYYRNVKRVDMYLRSIEELYNKRAEYMKRLPKNKPFYTKRIRNCNKNIHDNHDMMQFYQAKVEQFESKNNLI